MIGTAATATTSGASAFSSELHTKSGVCSVCSSCKCQVLTAREEAHGISIFFLSKYMHHSLLWPFCGISVVTVPYCSCLNERCKSLGKVACIPRIS